MRGRCRPVAGRAGSRTWAGRLRFLLGAGEGESGHAPNKGVSYSMKTEFRIMNFKPYSASGLGNFIVALTNYQKFNGSKQHLLFSYRSEM